jgi:ribokinase
MNINTPSPRKRTLSIGGATYDLFVRTGTGAFVISQDNEIRLPLGSKIRVQEMLERAGGGAANTSVGLRRLGFDAGFCGVMGDDQWGQSLLAHLQADNVDTSCLTIVEDEMTSFSLVLTAKSGERVILYTPGTNTHLHDSTFDKASAFSCDWIYLNHIAEESCMIENDLLEILTSDNGPGLSWNPGGFHITRGMQHPSAKALLAETDLLLLNREEALTFTSKEDVPSALRVLSDAGVTVACITDGANGAYATDGTTLYHCPVIQDAPVVDTTGAGDAFGTGATAALLHGETLPIILQSGTINATSVLGAVGAEPGLLTDIELAQRLDGTDLPVDATPLPPMSHVR